MYTIFFTILLLTLSCYLESISVEINTYLIIQSIGIELWVKKLNTVIKLHSKLIQRNVNTNQIIYYFANISYWYT